MLRCLSLLAALPWLLFATVTQGAEPAGAAPALLRWRAADGDFAGWELHAVARNETGTLRLAQPAPACAPSVFCGEALSPVMEGLSFQEAIPSWNIVTPAGTWSDVLLRVRVGGTWSGWYTLGIWTSQSDGPVRRQSVAGQVDTVARVATDTLVLRTGRAEALQVKLRLLSNGADNSPEVQTVGVALSDHPSAAPVLSQGNPARWGRSLTLPACSQMAYPDGGEAWCSPTSTAMVLRFWAEQVGGAVGPCEPWVRGTVAGVYDFVYDGHGNWPFNVAYAATQGLEGYVLRLESLEEAEEWIARGVPLVMSFGWGVGQLDGAPLPSSAGHLAVLSGFDAAGNPMFHDPAGSPASQVRRTYRRDQFERLWLFHSAGTVYLLAPSNVLFPPAHVYLPLVSR